MKSLNELLTYFNILSLPGPNRGGPGCEVGWARGEGVQGDEETQGGARHCLRAEMLHHLAALVNLDMEMKKFQLTRFYYDPLPPSKVFSMCALFIHEKTCLRMHQTKKTKFYNLLRHSSQQKTGVQQSIVGHFFCIFGFTFIILTIKVTERRPNKMRMRLIIFRFLSTIFWFILSSLTPAALSCGLLPSNSVSSSSLR